MLTIGGQSLEEIRVGVVTELGVSMLEGGQLRVLVSDIGQSTKVAETMIIPGRRCGRCEDRRVKCPEDCIK